MFHAADWMPTILGLAGGDSKSMKTIDGMIIMSIVINVHHNN